MKCTLQIGVIGPSDASPEEQAAAERIGHLIAERGGIVVCGGASGVMEAVCRGAREKGGRTLGILMGSSIRERNPYVEVAVATGMGQARNAAVVLSSDAIIAVGGGYGTLMEIAMALKTGIPVVGWHTWMAEVPSGGAVPEVSRSPWKILVAQSPEQAVEIAFQQADRWRADPRPAAAPSVETLPEEGRSPILDVH